MTPDLESDDESTAKAGFEDGTDFDLNADGEHQRSHSKLPAQSESYQRRFFGVTDTRDLAVARGPRRAPSSAGSMALDLDDLDDISAVSLESSNQRSEGSIYDGGLRRAGMEPPAADTGERDLSVAQDSNFASLGVKPTLQSARLRPLRSELKRRQSRCA